MRKIPINLQLGLRMALLIIAVSLCITGTALFAGSKKYSQMQIEANKEIGYELGRITAILTDQDDMIRYLDEVRKIYESAPPELRDVPDDPKSPYPYSVEHGAYEELYSSVMTPDYMENVKTLQEAARDIKAVDISLVFMDPKRNRMVFVICGVSDDKYSDYYSAPGYWMTEVDNFLDYTNDPTTRPNGIHVAFESIDGDDIMSSTVPFYHPDTGEVIGFVNVDRLWTNLDKERNQFLAGFMLIVGLVTLALIILSEAFLSFAIMRPLNKLTAEQSRMAAELDVAANIQLSMLPDLQESTAKTSAYSLHARLIPAKEVGGDFFDFFEIDIDKIAIVIADVVGKGVPASLFSMVAKTMLKMSALEGHEPAEICSDVNNRLCENNKEAMFVMVWFGIYTISERKLVYVNAGHNNAAVYNDREWTYDTSEGDMALGIIPDMPYIQHTMYLSDRDKVFLYTDGVVEAQKIGDGSELYGEERLTSCLSCDPDRTGQELIDAVYEDTCSFIGDSPQFDDIAMMLLEV